MTTTSTARVTQEQATAPSSSPITMGRLVKVETRKMFDTRSGFWLMVSILALSVIASVAVMIFSDPEQITFGSFGAAVGVPLGILLPVMAILMVTSEWSQRTGLVSFTLVPKRSRVITAKAITAAYVAVVSVIVALAVGALFNVIAASVRGVDMVWEFTALDALYIVLGNLVGVFFGFIYALLIRNSPGAIVAYVAWSFVLPGLTIALASAQDWFADLQPWIDLSNTSQYLFAADMDSAEKWMQLGTSSAIWLGIPLVIALITLRKSEVK